MRKNEMDEIRCGKIIDFADIKCGAAVQQLRNHAILDRRRIQKNRKAQKKKLLVSSLSNQISSFHLAIPSDSNEEDNDEEVLGLVSQSTIAHQPKKRKASYEDRWLASKKVVREERNSDPKRAKIRVLRKLIAKKSKGKNYLMMIHKQSVGLKRAVS